MGDLISKISTYASKITVGSLLNVVGEDDLAIVIANDNSNDDTVTEVIYQGSIATFANLPSSIRDAIAAFAISHFMIGNLEGKAYLCINISMQEESITETDATVKLSTETPKEVPALESTGNNVIDDFLRGLREVLGYKDVYVASSSSEFLARKDELKDNLAGFVDSDGTLFLRGVTFRKAVKLYCEPALLSVTKILYENDYIVSNLVESKGAYGVQVGRAGYLMFYKFRPGKIPFIPIRSPKMDDTEEVHEFRRAPILPDANFYVPFMQWLVVENLHSVSIGMIRKKFSIGGAKAKRILDTFEERGVIVPGAGVNHSSSVDVEKCKELLLHHKRASTVTGPIKSQEERIGA